MSDSIKIWSYNIVEDGTLTVTGTPDTGYPEARLYDRSINLYWFDTVTEAKTFHVDQGATVQDVDALWIVGHNFDGEDITWEFSDNDAAWSAAATGWTQSGNDPIIKTCTASNHQYWKVTVTSMTNPTCAEIWMGEGFSFDVAAEPSPSRGFQDNVSWTRSIGGQERSIKFGEERRTRHYTIKAESADLTNFISMKDDLDGFSKPFLLKDHTDAYFLARFNSIPNMAHILKTSVNQITNIPLDIIEQL